MATHILGLSCFYHDSAAALLKDGRIIAAAQEERFTRKRHDSDFPARAVAYVLKEAGIQPEEIRSFAEFQRLPVLEKQRTL